MKKVQRLLVLMLAGSMAMVSGCGEAGNRTENPQAEEEAEEQAMEPSEESAEELSELPESKESGQDVMQIVFSQETVDDYDPESGQWLLHMEYQTAEVTGGTEAAAEAVRQWSAQRAEEIEALRKPYAALAAEDLTAIGTDDYYRYSVYESLETARLDDRVISLIETSSEYTGGAAHGNYGSSGINFDAQSGERLELSDLLTDETAFREKAEDCMITKLSERYGSGLFPDYEEYVRQIWENSVNWYLDAAGIAFIFQPYEIGPYAMGEIAVTVPYAEVAECLEDSWSSYLLSGPFGGAGVAKIPEGETVSLYLAAHDSQPEQLRIYVSTEEPEYGLLHVELNGFSIETDGFERLGGAVLLRRTDGRVFVIFDADHASDDFAAFVYEITDGRMRECDQKEGLSLQGGTFNTESIRLNMHLDVLGSYRSMMDYTIDQEGKLIQSEEWFEIPELNDPWRQLVTIRELPVRINGEETTLPVGSTIQITATDNEGTARFTEISTGQRGEISYIRGNGDDIWTLYIDGISEYEYFEMIPYAG